MLQAAGQGKKVRTDGSHVHEAQLGVKGRIVVPQPIRNSLGVQEGDTLLFVEDDQGIRITTRVALIDALSGCLAEDDGRDFTEEFLHERRSEAQRDKGQS